MPGPRPEEYGCIGFALGIYGFAFQQAVVGFTRQHLPTGQAGVLCLYLQRGLGACPAPGEFACRGYATFGPFKPAGGIAKGHPDAQDLKGARHFYRELQEAFHPNGQG